MSNESPLPLFRARIFLCVILGLLLVRSAPLGLPHFHGNSKTHLSNSHDHRQCFDNKGSPGVVPSNAAWHIPPPALSLLTTYVSETFVRSHFQVSHYNRPPPRDLP